MQHPRFRAGALTTGFIAEEYPEGFHGAPADDELLEDLAIVAALVGMRGGLRAPAAISGQLGERVRPPELRVVRIDGREHRGPVRRLRGRPDRLCRRGRWRAS